ncbi:hypothetical protein M569_12510, partial [Genlisea aurea]
GQVLESRSRCYLVGFIFCLVLPTFIAIAVGIYNQRQNISYFLRPLWESQPKPFVNIPHYYHPNISIETRCRLHGWGIRDFPRQVYDAVLFNNEVDILVLRWKELSPYVNRFVLLESNSTFTGITKPLYFAMNRERFAFVESRLSYGIVGGRFRKEPFLEEAYQRVALDQLLRMAGIEDDDLVIMSDADEIPSGHTVDLLRWCDETPSVLHLQLRNYLYSFEFPHRHRSWRASVHRYRTGETIYAHYRQSDMLLADAGWHCSFCFRHISEFIFKMKAYSHADRIRFSHFLNPKRIQEIICRGGDLYDMLPEEHSFSEIIGSMGPIPRSYSAVHLPLYLVQNADEFRYLLPGNCIRETG